LGSQRRRGWQGKRTSPETKSDDREAMDREILIVDAEPNVLEGLQLVLRKDFSVVAAIGTVLELDGLAGSAEVEASFERGAAVACLAGNSTR